METIDCQGLKCPEPVIRTKNALDQGAQAGLKIIVDNETARENVIRFARNKGWKTFFKEEEGLFVVHVTAGSAEEIEAGLDQTTLGKESINRAVLLILNDSIGSGSQELGSLLMRNFIYTLTESEDLPEAIVFMNAGVKLCVKESPAIEDLNKLEAKGARLLVCGTCLDYYSLKQNLAAGTVSNMYDIADLLMAAGKTMTL